MHKTDGLQSKMEIGGPDAVVRSDYHTAHNRAGDPAYKKPLPETCFKCWEQAQRAKEAGQPPPKAPDEEWLNAKA